MYQKNTARKHCWQRAVLCGRELPENAYEPYFLLVDCPVPSFYYRKRPWPAAVLSECMAEAVNGARGMADAWLHPDIMTLVSEEERERWMPERDTLERLLACLMNPSAVDCLKKSGEAAVFMAKTSDTLWQMEMTERLLTPYLPLINKLTLYYEGAETDLWEEAEDCLEVYGYEYGLIPSLFPYGGAGTKGDYGCCRGLVLDYGAPLGEVRLQSGGHIVYVDLQCSALKERKCLAKGVRTAYLSPLKFLDTAVKSEYDRKM